MSMVKLLTAENQKNPEIFNLIEKFFILIKKNNWLMEYIIWELELLKLSGYDLNLSKIVKKTIENNKSNKIIIRSKVRVKRRCFKPD